MNEHLVSLKSHELTTAPELKEQQKQEIDKNNELAYLQQVDEPLSIEQ